MQAGRSALCIAAAVVLAACTGGQSGTETPAPWDDGGARVPGDDGGPIQITSVSGQCACALAPHSALLRVTLIELATCRVRARVEEVLAVAPELRLTLPRGAEITAVREAGCGDPPELEAGDPALLVYAPATDDGGDSRALVATWGSEHVFGTQYQRAVVLPQAERMRLLDSEACTAWFDQPSSSSDAMPEPAPPPACDAAR